MSNLWAEGGAGGGWQAVEPGNAVLTTDKSKNFCLLFSPRSPHPVGPDQFLGSYEVPPYHKPHKLGYTLLY